MAEPTQAALHFLPWVRQGAARDIAVVETLGAATQPATVPMRVRLRVNNVDVPVDTRLYGPGDVLGIDPRQVVRTDPRRLSANFEPNYFPSIEFDSPDFPWLFTPARQNAADQLRPWICLVVVKKQPGVTLRAGGGGALPILEIKEPAKPSDELPDLAESWAWAHAQVAGSVTDASPEAALKGRPDLTVSRLLCPRRLQPATAYIACVVPAFEIGVKAGLGLPITASDEGQLLPSWGSGAESPDEIALPVYYSWEFSTGTLGDFESLVRALVPRVLDQKVGRRELDISDPGYRIPKFTGAIVGLEAALRPVTSSPSPLPSGYQPALQKVLNEPSATAPQGVTDPVVGPPIYGDKYARADKVTNPPGWLNELNLDPRHRVAAGLGTEVVQQEQEQLMASAWEQVERIKPINQALRQAQLAVAAGAMIHQKHFRAMPLDALLQTTAPAHRQVLLSATLIGPTTQNLTLNRLIVDSQVPERAVSASMRKVARARGPVSRRFPTATVAQAQTVRPVFTILNGSFIRQTVAPGIATVDKVSEAARPSFPNADKIAYYKAGELALERTRSRIPFRIEPEGANVPPVPPPQIMILFPENPVAKSFREAALAHQKYMTGALLGVMVARRPFGNQQSLQTSLLDNLTPARTVTARLMARTNLPAAVTPAGEPPTEVMAAPEFPQPMYEALRDLSQDHLLPGLEHVPPNTVALLATNRRFIESFMIGLNHEMGRELLWREYPTDQRGLYFRQFWDARGTVSPPPRKDIQPLQMWNNADPLGKKYTGGDDQLVMLIRGELLRRYPGAVISAVRAVRAGGQLKLGAEEKFPIFRGSLQPDVTFLGFDLKRDQARGGDLATGDPGWFFVIEQQPGEPRFGMDEADAPVATKPAKWGDLSWGHVAPDATELARLQHARIKPSPLENHAIAGVKWGANAAHMASITMQKPVRIAIHAQQMIP